MKRDFAGYFLDKNGDAGDSCRAAGLWELFGGTDSQLLAYTYKQEGVYGVRHPFTKPWNNHKNQSRDQEICRMAGLWKMNTPTSRKQARNSFWAHARRLFFCNNFERDYVGSKKYPFPHSFINDKGVKELRWFDFADPLFLHHILHFIFCSRIYPLYIFAPIGWVFILPSVLFPDTKLDTEINQQIAVLEVYGKFWKRIYKKRNPKWIEQTLYYWVSGKRKRNQAEMAERIIGGFSK